MLNKGIVSKPILTRKKIGSRYVSELFNQYVEENWSGHISYRLAKLYEKADGILINSNFDTDRKISYEYNIHGDVIQYAKEDNVPFSVLWGYGGQYPIAEIENMTYQDVVNIIGQATVNNLNLANVSETTVRTAINLLRNHPNTKKTRIQSYTYKPLVGMVSKTDVRGVTEYYEYDRYNRLSVVKDHQGDIIKTYCYNYKGEQVDCHTYSGTISTGGTPIYDSKGNLLAMVWGSTDLNDYALSSFERSPNSSGGFMIHNIQYYGFSGPASIDYYTGSYGLDFWDTFEDFLVVPNLDPNKRYKVSYMYRSWSDWHAGWKKTAYTFNTGITNFVQYFDETTIDDFMLYPAGSYGEMYIYNPDGSLKSIIYFD